MSSPAPAARQAIQDANQRWPSRKKASDGIMGDARHQKRKSDHNMGNAVDITHDPASGCDGNVIASLAIQDARVTYVIWNHRIYNRSRAAEGWRPYNGTNPHTKHCHISISSASRNDTRSWAWISAHGGGGAQPGGGDTAPRPGPSQPAPAPAKPAPKPAPPKPGGGAVPYPNVMLRNGTRGPSVKRVQARLDGMGWEIVADGIFGPITERVVKSFQRRRGLVDDGVVGPKTWRALFG